MPWSLKNGTANPEFYYVWLYNEYFVRPSERFALRGHLEGVEEVADELVEADCHDEIGELGHREQLQRIVAVGTGQRVVVEQFVGPGEDADLVIGQALGDPVAAAVMASADSPA